MLRNAKVLFGFTVSAQDGEIGTVRDILFEDGSWTVRYLVVRTGAELEERDVLIAATVLEQPDGGKRTFPVSLTKDQIQNSPPLASDKPVSRQHETDLHAFFGWQPYWEVERPASDHSRPLPPAEDAADDHQADSIPQEIATGDPNLRSASEMLGYVVRTTDAEAGEVFDLAIDDVAWRLKHLVVDISRLIKEQKFVVVAARRIERVSWDEFQVLVDVDADTVKDSPPIDPDAALDAAFEESLEKYYAGRES